MICHRSSSYFLEFRQFLNELCPFLDLEYLFSALFFYMLSWIELKFCIYNHVSQIKFIFPPISSIFEWVMPLFELRIFVSALFSYIAIDLKFCIYGFVIMCHRSCSHFLGFRQFLNELCPFLDLEYLSISAWVMHFSYFTIIL